MRLPEPYLQAMNSVLAINFFGEALATDLITRLLRAGGGGARAMLTSQRKDEVRHARQTRRILLDRGYDPIERDSPAVFSFAPVFADYTGGTAEEAMACLCENETLSSRNFRMLARLAHAFGDEPVERLYRAVSAEEEGHAVALAAALPAGDADVTRVRTEARDRMGRIVSDRYLRLLVLAGDAGRSSLSGR